MTGKVLSEQTRVHKVVVLALAYLKGKEWAAKAVDRLIDAPTCAGVATLDALEVPEEYMTTLCGAEVEVYMSTAGYPVLRVQTITGELYGTYAMVFAMRNPPKNWALANAFGHVAYLLRGCPGSELLRAMAEALRP